MNLYEKLLEMQKRVDSLIKDGKNLSDKYDFASDENVLDRFRPMMDEYSLLLIPRVEKATLHEGTTKSGTARFLTEVTLSMVWHDVESKEELITPWYAQGVDLAGEKGVGKALTYAEKYFLLKFFHVPTKKDDPDGDAKTKSGEKRQRGTAAEKENTAYYRKAIPQMLDAMFPGNPGKVREAYIFYTKAPSRGFAGYDSIDAVGDLGLAPLYGKIKENYEKRIGRPFQMKENAADAE